ncbi:hypothetical protein [Allobranchiibius sp. CTAmp26]|uniref:hypothetical protein n=1 Tax=Allobranchiibius sp. CTAmp26 TaxID=2815214 RepID=UPI001AA0E2E4|nr:hypothetical protein [Allobranchiibius sp. CTAmp26]MBO1755525.1 hypothetical protein [Allobranchiibius sp. CTAmp26]
MDKSTRRNFVTIAGLGSAAGLAAMAVPSAANAATARDVSDHVQVPHGAASSMAAFVSDVHRGEVTLMVDGDEVTVTDKQLAARLAHAFHQAARV